MKKHKPSNKIADSGLAWLSGSSLLGGAVIGGIAQFIAQYIYLIILFPLGMGLLGGGVMTFAIRKGKVRNPLIAAGFGMLTGLSICGSMHGLGYVQFKQSATEQIVKEVGPVRSKQSDQIIDIFLKEETGSSGFWGYLKYSAQEGVTISPRGNSELNLGETGTWIYWLIELIVIDAIIVAITYASAKHPYCETCDQWYDSEKYLGGISTKSSKSFLKLLNEGRFDEAGKLVDPIQGIVNNSLEALVLNCSSCSTGNPILTVKNYSFNEKRELKKKEVIKGSLSQEQWEAFQEEIDMDLQNSHASEISRAQQERSIVSDSDQFISSGLNPTEIDHISQQISQYSEVKEGYFVRKEAQYFPEKPCYVLGIKRRKKLIESESEADKLINKLMSELDLPSQTLITCLNKQKKIEKAIIAVEGTAIYQQ